MAFARFLRTGRHHRAATRPVQARAGQRAARPGDRVRRARSRWPQMVQWMLAGEQQRHRRDAGQARGDRHRQAGHVQRRGAAPSMAVDAKLGVRGIHLHDGSGLSPLDLISPAGAGQAGRAGRQVSGCPVSGRSSPACRSPDSPGRWPRQLLRAVRPGRRSARSGPRPATCPGSPRWPASPTRPTATCSPSPSWATTSARNSG